MMEQSVSMEIPEYAQESVRQQLEALSSKLLEDNEQIEDDTSEGWMSERSMHMLCTSLITFIVHSATEACDVEESLPVIEESADLHPASSSLPYNQSMPSLPSMIAPPRNPSYLSRALSSEACIVTSSSQEVNDMSGVSDQRLVQPATDRMDYAQVRKLLQRYAIDS